MNLKHVILITITLLLVLACVLLYGASRCQPLPPTPTVTKSATLTATLKPGEPTYTPRPTFTATLKPGAPTYTPRPTFTPWNTYTPVPTATKNYCWWNPYMQAWACYPRLNWHPAPGMNGIPRLHGK